MYNDVKETHVNREKCVAMHTNYLLNFKTVLYSSIYVLNNSRKLKLLLWSQRLAYF